MIKRSLNNQRLKMSYWSTLGHSLKEKESPSISQERQLTRSVLPWKS